MRYIAKIFIFLMLTTSLLMLGGCQSKEKNENIAKFIQETQAATKPTSDTDLLNTEALKKPIIEDITPIRNRNPFTISSGTTQANDAGTQQIGNLKLVGVVNINEKKWAIIRASGKIYKVTVGQLIGLNKISQITDKTVTFIRTDDPSEEAITLTLQE